MRVQFWRRASGDDKEAAGKCLECRGEDGSRDIWIEARAALVRSAGAVLFKAVELS